ncbi:hypothetical protein NMY22_g15078 [Coprinellus aureogranulatus]|nr:hypothetical protein NMY22_g15078 [Coprinellus aureogranulatus]
MFLNIGATLSGFLITDAMGSMQYRAATVPEVSDGKTFDAGDVCNAKHRYVTNNLPAVLKQYTRGLRMDMLVLHWFTSFVGGIIGILALILLYVLVEERVVLKVVAILLTVYAILPGLYWVWRLAKAKDGSSSRCRTAELSEANHATGITGNPSNPVVATPLFPQHAERSVRSQQLRSDPSSSGGSVHRVSP